MSDFLTRLVQRTRGEAAVVRPVSHAVTAPDPTNTAWDEQIAIREAPPLVCAPRAVLPPQQVPYSAPAPAPERAAPYLPDSRLELERATEVQAAPITPSQIAPAVTAATPSLPAARPPVRNALRASLEPTRPQPRESEAHEREGASATTHITVARERFAQPPMPDVQEIAAAAQTLALAQPRRADAEPIAARSASTAAPAPSFMPPALAPERLQALELSTEPAPSAVRLAPHAEAAALGMAAALPLARHADDRNQLPNRTRRALDSALHEHSTTVEVSIGRIEVRLPPRPRNAADDTQSLAKRRAPVGLAEYLDSRETGKSR